MEAAAKVGAEKVAARREVVAKVAAGREVTAGRCKPPGTSKFSNSRTRLRSGHWQGNSYYPRLAAALCRARALGSSRHDRASTGWCLHQNTAAAMAAAMAAGAMGT